MLPIPATCSVRTAVAGKSTTLYALPVLPVAFCFSLNCTSPQSRNASCTDQFLAYAGVSSRRACCIAGARTLQVVLQVLIHDDMMIRSRNHHDCIACALVWAAGVPSSCQSLLFGPCPSTGLASGRHVCIPHNAFKQHSIACIVSPHGLSYNSSI